MIAVHEAELDVHCRVLFSAASARGGQGVETRGAELEVPLDGGGVLTPWEKRRPEAGREGVIPRIPRSVASSFCVFAGPGHAAAVSRDQQPPRQRAVDVVALARRCA